VKAQESYKFRLVEIIYTLRHRLFSDVVFNHRVFEPGFFDRVPSARILISAKNSSRNLKLVKIENAAAETLKPVW